MLNRKHQLSSCNYNMILVYKERIIICIHRYVIEILFTLSRKFISIISPLNMATKVHVAFNLSEEENTSCFLRIMVGIWIQIEEERIICWNSYERYCWKIHCPDCFVGHTPWTCHTDNFDGQKILVCRPEFFFQTEE